MIPVVKPDPGAAGDRAFRELFLSGEALDGPAGLAFGPDGNLYVTSRGTNAAPDNNTILRFNGQTGAWMDTVASGLQRRSPTRDLLTDSHNAFAAAK